MIILLFNYSNILSVMTTMTPTQDFLFYKYDNVNDTCYVTHSRYWRLFDGHFGRQNEILLSQLQTKYGFQVIAISDQTRVMVYDLFMQWLSQGCVTKLFDLYQKRIGHDLAITTPTAFKRWVEEYNKQERELEPSNEKKSWSSVIHVY